MSPDRHIESQNHRLCKALAGLLIKFLYSVRLYGEGGYAILQPTGPAFRARRGNLREPRAISDGMAAAGGPSAGAAPICKGEYHDAT